MDIHQTPVVKVDLLRGPLLLVCETRITAWPHDRSHGTLADVLDLLVDTLSHAVTLSPSSCECNTLDLG